MESDNAGWIEFEGRALPCMINFVQNIYCTCKSSGRKGWGSEPIYMDIGHFSDCDMYIAIIQMCAKTSGSNEDNVWQFSKFQL